MASKSLLQSSESLGSDILIQLLKNYSRNLNLKTSISVGIVGYPNVGKSSLINSLKRTKAVGVGATPGFTKTTQVCEISAKFHFFFSQDFFFVPGIYFF
jgi:nuclear GTP-binding protein